MQRPDAQDCTNPLLWQVLPSLRERLFSGLNLPNETTMTLHERVVEILVELETQYVRNLAQYARYCNNAAPRTPVSTTLSRWPSFSPTSETGGIHGRELGSPTSPVPDSVSAHLLPCSPLSAVIPSSPGTPHSNPASERIILNIGGKMFEATRDTWTAEPGSILDVLVSGRFSVQRCPEGAIYIDRDPKYFPFLMTYLRYRRDPLTRVTYRLSIAYFTLREQLRSMPSDCDRSAVLEEARFYGLQDFVHLFGTRPCIAMVGGYGPNSVFPVKTAEIFDLTRNEWEVNLPLSTLRGRFYTAAGVYQNQLYVIGGWDASTRHEFTVVEKFDPDTDEWSVVSQLPEYRMCHTCAVHEATGCIYVIGGATKTNQPLNTVWCWDIRNNVWTQLPLMKHARIFAACAVVNDHLWVIGGENKSEVLNTVEKFDLYKKEWSAGPSLPCARRAHAAVGLGNDVFVFGGNADRGFHNILSTVEKISTNSKTPKWVSVRPMLHPRSYFAAVVCDNYIYAIGGDTLAANVFRRADTVERYDAVMDCWVPRQPLNGFRSGQVCAVIHLPIVKPRSLSDSPEFCPPPELDQHCGRSQDSSDAEVLSPVIIE